jgi:[CysO sulfur-carrier protein]-S-L-cysteine hydrolase
MLELPASMVEEMRQHCECQAPAEACGLIGGSQGVGTRHFAIENVAVDPRRYEMDSRQLYQTLVHIEDAGLELVAIYHSHTSSAAFPSPTDVELAFYPDVYYVIISLLATEQRRLRAFTIQDHVIAEQNLIQTR